jgi:hypothetical protein
MAQGYVGNMTFVDCMLQNKDGVNDVPMFVAMKDPAKNGMHEILGQQMNKIALDTYKSCTRRNLVIKLFP